MIKIFSDKYYMRELYHMLDINMLPLVDMTMPTSRRHHRIPNSNINPALIELLSFVNIIPIAGAIFYSCPGFYTKICHVDIHDPDVSKDWPSLGKLNYIIGEPQTSTMWYEVAAENRNKFLKLITVTAQPYHSYDLNHCDMIESKQLHGWHLFEAGIPHTVANPTQNPKWTITFVMRDILTKKWLSFTECKSRLQCLPIHNA